MRYYEAFGLAPALAIDQDDLKKRFYEGSRKWHPDRFSRASASEQAQALEMTSLINDAFRTLRDPVARAEYYLQERGVEMGKEVPPELLEEVFELNMALEELREGDASARPQLEAASERFNSMLGEIDSQLQALFRTGDEPLDMVRSLLNRRRYIANLVRDVQDTLNGNASN